MDVKIRHKFSENMNDLPKKTYTILNNSTETYKNIETITKYKKKYRKKLKKYMKTNKTSKIQSKSHAKHLKNGTHSHGNMQKKV